jgi:UDP-N-acetylmuramate: L-alanyl-gamma-D-glutamyl-meso-diaminopimelate ligase
MHVHILGICGTFMGGIAALARAAGHRVSGADQNVYPPMSTQLENLGIEITEGYGADALDSAADVVVVGNVMTRGMPVVEALLDSGRPYTSGPEWLARHVLAERWVLAVAGTHGKTTTSSILAWLLEDAGLDPGFLIGGIPGNFGISARLGSTPFFVVEADEYDTAFFDKRSKFVHYRPRTLILNNLEYDHADIFPDLAAILRQFHHLVRTVPGAGLIVANGTDASLRELLEMGCWTPVETFSGPDGEGEWRVSAEADGVLALSAAGREEGRARWTMPGSHNAENALAAVLAARHAGVPVASSLAALGRFEGIRRRMERRGEVGGVTVYDDFAHHPTAIARTLDGLRRAVGDARIVAVIEPRSNTMRMGVHVDELGASLAAADAVHFFRPPGLTWDLQAVAAGLEPPGQVSDTLDGLLGRLVSDLRRGDHVLVMSNGGFGGIHQKLLDALAARACG